jgi:FMN phosphatase YigB (HAD superfamily)
MITTILLDAGGVILDESEHEEVRMEIATRILSDVVAGYSAAALRHDIDEAIRVFCSRILAYVFWKRVRPDLELFGKLYGAFLAAWRERRPPLKVMPGFAAEVEAISRHFEVGIAGQYGRDLLDLLRKEGILDHFKHRFTQDDFDITKPDPRYLERIAAACGVRPAECIMVGDRVDNDIVPAKQIGMRTVLVRGGLHRRQTPRIPAEMPDAVLKGIAGLADAVLRVARVNA